MDQAHGPSEERRIDAIIRARKPYDCIGAL